jgi:hypothetical protein
MLNSRSRLTRRSTSTSSRPFFSATKARPSLTKSAALSIARGVDVASESGR